MAQLLLLHLLAAVSVAVVATDEIDAIAAEGDTAAGSHGGGCTAENALTLEMMDDKAQSEGAVCLDGSPGGYYIQMAKNKTNNWQICEPTRRVSRCASPARARVCVCVCGTEKRCARLGGLSVAADFMGGGWCYSKADCLGRSKTNLGSSRKWPLSL